MKKKEMLLGRCFECEKHVYQEDLANDDEFSVFIKEGLCPKCSKSGKKRIVFSIDYFIDKFENIPEEEWAISTYKERGKRCALGHCGELKSTNPTKESLALESIFGEFNLRASLVNDGQCESYKQETPKQRILAALKNIKEKL